MTRRWLFWLLIVAFIWVVASRATEVRTLIWVLLQGQWPWIAVAALFQAAYYLTVTWCYQVAFRIVGIRGRFRDRFMEVFGALFANVVVPAGGLGMPGTALFVDDATRRGESPGGATTATLLSLVADYAAFSLILLIGLIELFIRHDLKRYELVGALLLMAFIVGLTGLFCLGLWRPDLLSKLLGRAQAIVKTASDRLRRPSPLPDDWPGKWGDQFTEAGGAVRRNASSLALLFGVAQLAYAFDLASVCALFLAFEQPIRFGPLVAGFAIGMVFWIISVTPEGIGVVEGVMTMVYSSLGIPTEAAVLVSLPFRGLSFWLPLVADFFCMRYLKSFEHEERRS